MARSWDVQYVNFYTAGSAAVKYHSAPVAKKQEAELPKPRKKKRVLVYVNPVAVMGIFMAVVMLCMMFAGMNRLARVQQEKAQMQQYVQQLQEENARLQAEYEAGYDANEIYEIATAMGMIPAEQAQHIQVQVTVPEATQSVSAWENFCAFLTGLFA